MGRNIPDWTDAHTTDTDGCEMMLLEWMLNEGAEAQADMQEVTYEESAGRAVLTTEPGVWAIVCGLSTPA